MIVTRREAIIGTGAVSTSIALLGSSAARSAQEEAEETETLLDLVPALPSDLQPFESQGDVAAIDLEPVQLGTQTPTTAEIQMAARILSASPHDTRKPIDVARFFREVGQGALNVAMGEDVRHYVRGWPVRYNPVIINFFRATGTDPLAARGDFTPWCAAFLNWCIARAHSADEQVALNQRGFMSPFARPLLERGTRSASSGSFRCWSTERNGQAPAGDPLPGDVIVWALRGTVNGCRFERGHVGFFAGRAPDGRFRTLGGNQTDPASGKSAVVEKLMPRTFRRSDGTCEFHSIRST